MDWIDEAIRYILNTKINHRNWLNALYEALAVLSASEPGEILSIVGPNRVGKSKILDALLKFLIGEDSILLPGFVPYAKIVLANKTRQGFTDTKQFWIDALESIKHPFYGVNSPADKWGLERLRLLNNSSASTLQRVFEEAIDPMKIRYIVIDEIQHILRFYGGEKAAAFFLDDLKSIAQIKNLGLIVAGTYPTLEAMKLTNHAVGREYCVHFPRYQTTKDDIAIFNKILSLYSKVLHFEPGVNSLLEWNEYLYKGSIGCVGLLSKWLRSALAIAKSRNDSVLRIEHLEHTIRSIEKLSSLESEILVGEEALVKPRFSAKDSMHNDVQFSESFESESADKKRTGKEKSSKKKKAKPFKTKPARYPVDGRS